MFKKSPLKATQLHRKKRRILMLKIAGVFLLFVVLVVGVVVMLRNDRLTIDEIIVEGNAAVETEDIQKIAQATIEGNYVYLIPKSNRFLYQEDKIIADIQQQIPRISEVKTHVDGQALIISISERAPAYTWCTGQPQKIKSQCYFIDEGGYIFSEAPSFSGNVYVAFYGLITGESAIGSTYLDRQSFATINSFVDFLKSKDISPYALLASSNGVYELYFADGAKIIFKNDQASSTLMSNTDLVMRDTGLLSAPLIGSLEYVDLRFGNKLYYKLKSGDNQLQIEEEPGV